MLWYDPSRFFANIFQLQGSVIKDIIPQLVVSALLGAVAGFVDDTYGFHISTYIHQILGVALGLLLVFRSNISFQRYWEGRTHFGMIVFSMRNLMRQVTLFVPMDDQDGERAVYDMRRYISACYVCIQKHVRYENDLDVLKKYLTTAEIDELHQYRNRPFMIIQWLTLVLASFSEKGAVSDYKLMQLDTSLSNILEHFHGVDKISSTPFPFPYAQTLSMFLSLFCFSVPFALSEELGYYSCIASVFISFGYFSIYAVGVELEDPFGHDANDLPLTQIGINMDDDLEHIFRTTRYGIRRLPTMSQIPLSALRRRPTDDDMDAKGDSDASSSSTSGTLEDINHDEDGPAGGADTVGLLRAKRHDGKRAPMLGRIGAGKNKRAGYGAIPYSINGDEESQASLDPQRRITVAPPQRGVVVN